MNSNVVLLVDADADTCALTLDAAKTLGLEVRFAQIERDLSELTQISLDDVAVVVLDYDPDVHGLAIGELLEHWQPSRPMILISSEEGLNHSFMLIGVHARHLTKPVTVARLVHAFRALLDAETIHSMSCDRWGHPCSERSSYKFARNRKKVAA